MQQHRDSSPHMLLLPSAVSKVPKVKGPDPLSTGAHTLTWDRPRGSFSAAREQEGDDK